MQISKDLQSFQQTDKYLPAWSYLCNHNTSIYEVNEVNRDPEDGDDGYNKAKY